MLDIFNHRACSAANPANKNALMAPWMSLPADRSCCSWRNSGKFSFTFLSSFQLASLKPIFLKILLLITFSNLQMTPPCMTIAYGCWRPSLLALKFRLIRQDRISGSGQVNNMKQHSLARECCSREGGMAGTDGPNSY